MKKRLALPTLLLGALSLQAQHYPTPQVPGTLYEQGARWNSKAWQTPYRENLSDTEKQAGLALVWSEVKYNFAFFDHVPQLDWDSLYMASQPNVLTTKTTAAYYDVLRSMVARLQDGHTAVLPPMEEWQKLAKPAFTTALIENKVLVTGLINPALSSEGITPGLEIVTVNGEDVQAYANRAIRPYVFSSTEQNRLVQMYDYQFLTLRRGETVDLTFRDAQGRTFNRKVPLTQPLGMMPGNSRTFEYRVLPGNIAYVALNYFDHESIAAKFDSIYPQLKTAKALILDVRQNGGGNSQYGWDIVAKLTNRDFPMGQWQTRNYRPVDRAWGNKQQWFGDKYVYNINRKDTTDYFHGPVAVLTSGKTNSAAEDFLSAFRQAKRGVLVGEPSSGSTGQPLFVPLPGGGMLAVCSKRDAMYDGTEWVGKGFQPDVPAQPTVAAFRQGKDLVLEKAVDVLTRQLQAPKLQAGNQ